MMSALQHGGVIARDGTCYNALWVMSQALTLIRGHCPEEGCNA